MARGEKTHLRLSYAVTFDPTRGYVATHPDLPVVTALSLKMLRQRVGKDVRLVLDRAARRERDARRGGGVSRASDA